MRLRRRRLTRRILTCLRMRLRRWNEPWLGSGGLLKPFTDDTSGSMLRFENLNYQGIEFGGSKDVSGKEHLRLICGQRQRVS